MLKIEQLTFGYTKDLLIFENLNIELNAKNIGLMGENGAGKTTMLNLIAGNLSYEGLLTPTNSVYFPKEISNKYDKLTVKEFFDLIGYIDSFDCTELIRYIEELNFLNYYNYEIGTLSKGSKKKIHLILSLLAKDELILIDEPFESIDSSSNTNYSRLLKQKENAFIIVSHDYSFLRKATDVIYEIRNGIFYENI